jgi:hypothetical protein
MQQIGSFQRRRPKVCRAQVAGEAHQASHWPWVTRAFFSSGEKTALGGLSSKIEAIQKY